METLLSVLQAQLEILQPLAPEVTTLLRQYSQEGFVSSGQDICFTLSDTLKSGELLWSRFAHAVVRLDDQIAVNIVQTFRFSGGITYAFMSLVEGHLLDKLWPDLSIAEKYSVRDQLDIILEKLHPRI
ncbi:hypothetical protein EMCG_03807 [[Emmonsia] crescens]|uniref:Uncharacterized protein n=1 Tax=[Emmonsia] crescens TaxID=73230 RepID=A0A0G2HU48_9EURO|nr:hypothetical protein EMCG_03807 [Emmonsia crescens UAMH 3008]